MDASADVADELASLEKLEAVIQKKMGAEALVLQRVTQELLNAKQTLAPCKVGARVIP